MRWCLVRRARILRTTTLSEGAVMADLKTVKPPAEKKRLAVFMDGTTDTSEGNTNVWRARSLCAPHGTDDLEQRVFYSVGVGTRMGEKARGEVFGYGIDDQVIEAYQWLVENYEKDDEIFVFGFSRGAYAARSLSGYISRCGLESLLMCCFERPRTTGSRLARDSGLPRSLAFGRQLTVVTSMDAHLMKHRLVDPLEIATSDENSSRSEPGLVGRTRA
jgi:hypothetical protein